MCRLFSSSGVLQRSESVRIGCSSGFWGDTSVSGNLESCTLDGYVTVVTCSSTADTPWPAGLPGLRLPLRDHHVTAGCS